MIRLDHGKWSLNRRKGLKCFFLSRHSTKSSGQRWPCDAFTHNLKLKKKTQFKRTRMFFSSAERVGNGKRWLGRLRSDASSPLKDSGVTEAHSWKTFQQHLPSRSTLRLRPFRSTKRRPSLHSSSLGCIRNKLNCIRLHLTSSDWSQSADDRLIECRFKVMR